MSVHIQTGLNPKLIPYVKEKEGDHINDYLRWENGRGKVIAQERENRFKTLRFPTAAACEKSTSTSLDGGLKAGGIVRTASRQLTSGTTMVAHTIINI